ncbi:polysialyltransferase family glycosyltransferase [Vibrio cyclitrophicus]
MKTLIFCQSMKYVTDTLNLYDYYCSKGYDVHILVREVELIFDFFEEKIEISKDHLIFLEVHKQSSLTGILKNRQVIINCKKLINSMDFEQCILFTNEFDFSSFGVLNGYTGTVKILDYSRSKIINNPPLKSICKAVTEYVFYGVLSNPFLSDRHYFSKRDDTPEFNYPNKIKRDKIKYPFKNNSVLFIDSNDQSNGILSNVEETLRETIELISSNSFNIYVKGHPRLGLSPVFNQEKNITILDNAYPIEFLDLSDASLVIGFYSTSLATIEHNRVYSILEINSIDDTSYQHEYLIKNGFSNDCFIDNLNTLEKILKSS